MNMRWRKVMGDLGVYRVQIGLIALVLMLGAACVTAALNGRAILKREIALSYAGAASPDIAILLDRVDPALVAAVAREEGVAAADARRVTTLRVAAGDGSWLPMRLIVMRDFAAQSLGKVHLHGAAWPPADGAIFVEQSGRALIGASPLRVRAPGGDIVSLPIAGFVHDPAVAPSTQERQIYAYATPATAVLLGLSADLDQLQVKMEYRGSSSDAREFGETLKATLAKRGLPASRVDVLPAAHPHAALMGAMLSVLGVLSALAFVCSAALAGYLVSAWMRREVRVVGIMKTLGARPRQIALQYLALVGPAVMIAIAVAIPAGIRLGHALVDYYAVSLNIDLADRSTPISLTLLELAFSFCIPLIAMTVPIARAARMTAHSAIHDVGIAPLSGAARWAARLIRIPGRVSWSLAIRNSWRRPWRLAIMLLGLSAGGGLLLTTHSDYESFMHVIDASLDKQGHDIEVQFPRRLPAAKLEAIARAVPGVKTAEAWRRTGVYLIPPAGATGDSHRVTLTGYPPSSALFKLPVVEGKAPAAPSGNDGPFDILITRALQHDYAWLQTGSVAELRFDERHTAVRVAGVVEEIAMSAIYADANAFEAITRLGDASSLVRVKTGGDRIELVANALDQAFLDARLPPAQVFTRAMLRDALDEHFKVVGDVIQMVALTMALVGAIVLAATTLLNITERAREIGVLRALGASPARIARLFLIEGASITFTGFLLAIAMSIPLTLLMLQTAERRLLHVAVPLQFSWSGLAILLCGGLIVLLTVLVSVAQARRKTVNETIAYE